MGGLASNSGYSRLIPFSLCDRASAAFAGSCLSLRLREWKIFVPFAFSTDVLREWFSPEPTTVDFWDSDDGRDLARAAVDSPLGGDEVDVRGATILSILLENDLLRLGRCAFVNASMCSYTYRTCVELRHCSCPSAKYTTHPS